MLQVNLLCMRRRRHHGIRLRLPMCEDWNQRTDSQQRAREEYIFPGTEHAISFNQPILTSEYATGNSNGRIAPSIDLPTLFCTNSLECASLVQMFATQHRME